MPKHTSKIKQAATKEAIFSLILKLYLPANLHLRFILYCLCRGHAKHRSRQALWSGIEPKGGSNTFHPSEVVHAGISKSNTESNTELSVKHTLNFFALNWGLLTFGYCFCLHPFGASINGLLCAVATCNHTIMPLQKKRSMHDPKRQDGVCDNSFSYNSYIKLPKLPMRDCARFVDTSRSAIAMVHAPNSTEMSVKLRCPGDSL